MITPRQGRALRKESDAFLAAQLKPLIKVATRAATTKTAGRKKRKARRK